MRKDYTLTDFFKDTAVIVDENMKLRRQIDKLTKNLEAWKNYAAAMEQALGVYYMADDGIKVIEAKEKLEGLGEI